uniref:Malectin_like domain-containing protein n=1 Tax=Steinernema glaseri TaxID=37863 RepID=A0A1I8AC24_9BILA
MSKPMGPEVYLSDRDDHFLAVSYKSIVIRPYRYFLSKLRFYANQWNPTNPRLNSAYAAINCGDVKGPAGKKYKIPIPALIIGRHSEGPFLSFQSLPSSLDPTSGYSLLLVSLLCSVQLSERLEKF